VTDQPLFTVYVDGPDQARAVRERLRELCEPVGVVPEVRVVDVVADPATAETANVIGTPTVVLEHPPPRRRLIGMLDDDRRARSALGLDRFQEEETA
jgi:circadian clock protein KaiB